MPKTVTVELSITQAIMLHAILEVAKDRIPTQSAMAAEIQAEIFGALDLARLDRG